jgi:hypothetical protein
MRKSREVAYLQAIKRHWALKELGAGDGGGCRIGWSKREFYAAERRETAGKVKRRIGCVPEMPGAHTPERTPVEMFTATLPVFAKDGLIVRGWRYPWSLRSAARIDLFAARARRIRSFTSMVAKICALVTGKSDGPRISLVYYYLRIEFKRCKRFLRF